MRHVVQSSLLLLLAGCGGGEIDLNESGDTEETDDVDAGDSFAMRVDGMSLAATGIGFNLDSHETTSAQDPVGCGKVDGAGGADNALAGIASQLSGFGFDLQSALVDAVASGDLVLDFTVSDYHGPDDDHVLLDVEANGDTVATDVSAYTADGILWATIPSLPLSGEAGGSAFSVSVRQVRLAMPLDGAPADASVTAGMLGGGVPWDEAGENDLRALVLANLPSWMPESTAEGLVRGWLDLQPPGGGNACDAISIALIVDASAL